MEAGALGIGSSLIYAPAFYAKTEELIESCKVAAKYKGKYISHMRSEGNQLLEAVRELIRISREAGLPAEIYHLKAAGQSNWPKMDQAIALVEDARRQGLKISDFSLLSPEYKDDDSIRKAIKRLINSVGLSAEDFASAEDFLSCLSTANSILYLPERISAGFYARLTTSFSIAYPPLSDSVSALCH